MGYSRKISNYLEKIILLDLTHMMSMANVVAIRVKTLRLDSWCSLEKDFSKLIYMNL